MVYKEPFLTNDRCTILATRPFVRENLMMFYYNPYLYDISKIQLVIYISAAF